MILLRPGDLVLSGINAMKGAIAIYDSVASMPAAATIHYSSYQVDVQRADPRYLWWLLRSAYFRDVLQQQVPQGIKTELKAARLLPVVISLPPLDEQQRIVARIKVLADRVTASQALQEAAIDEAGALWASGAARIFGRLEGALGHRIEEFAEVRGGLQKSPERLPRDNPTPYLTVAHVQRNRIDLSAGLRYFEILPRELPKWKLEPGDVLIIEGNGSADQIGRAAIFRGEVENCVHQNHVIRVRTNQSIVLPEYLNGYLNSPVGMEEVRQRSRTTSGLLSLSVKRIRAIELPVPSIPEQKDAVEALGRLRARVDALRDLQQSSQAELAALLPAVLDKAFQGDL